MEEIDWGIESDEGLLEYLFGEREVPIFEEIEIEESDSFRSEFSSGPEESFHFEEGSTVDEGQESSSPDKVTQNGIRENGGAVSEEVHEGKGGVEIMPSLPAFEGSSVHEESSAAGEAGMRNKSDEVITEGNLIETRTESVKDLIPAERELDEGTSDGALKEIIDKSEDGSLEKAHKEVTGVGMESKKDADKVQISDNEEARKDADKVQSSDHLEASVDAAVELNSTASAVKMEEVSARRYNLISGGFLFPDPTKEFGGEDAYFIAGQNWLGVADGVGDWATRGINAGDYARELMENCQKIVSDSIIPLTNPKEVLIRSALEARSPGSSTILVSYFDGQVLHVANIGDSGFIVIRSGTVYEKSTPRHWSFNCPFQIQYGDEPAELVEEYHIDLEEGDVIVTATDGLFDNLYEQEIASIVSGSLQENLEPKDIAEFLAKRANQVGGLDHHRTPFADAVAMEFGVEEVLAGGKLDDVTVVVSLVQKRLYSQME